MLPRLDNAKLKLLIFNFLSGNGEIRIFKMKIKLLENQRTFEIEFFHNAKYKNPYLYTFLEKKTYCNLILLYSLHSKHE